MRPPLHDCMESRILTRVPAHFDNVVCASSANCVCVCVCVCVFIGISDTAKYSALNNPIVSHTFCIALGGISDVFKTFRLQRYETYVKHSAVSPTFLYILRQKRTILWHPRLTPAP